MRTFLVSILAGLACFTASAQFDFSSVGFMGTLGYTNAPTGGGNNAAIVAGHTAITNGPSGISPVTITIPGGVTSGNMIEMMAIVYQGTTYNFAGTEVSRVAGSSTATIGTVTMDCFTNALSGVSGSALFHAMVTGSGTLTMQLNVASTTLIALGGAECTGINATPLQVAGKNAGTATAAPWAATTGGISTAMGIMFSLEEDDGSTNWATTGSDTILYSLTTPATTLDYVWQAKLVNASTYTMTNTVSPSNPCHWHMLYANYKSN